MKVLYCDEVPNERLETEVGAKRVGLEEILKGSDYVSLHVPLTEETRHMIGEAELAMMKGTSYLINTCRGPAVDEKALVKALKEDAIAGAALDVFEDEPALAPGLNECANAVIVPHIGSGSRETRAKMARMAAENCVAGMKGETPANIVNPEVLEK